MAREQTNHSNIKLGYHQYQRKKRKVVVSVVVETEVISYLKVKQRMGNKIETASEIVSGRHCLDEEYLLGKMFSARRFIIVFYFFFKTEAQCSSPVLKSFKFGLFYMSEYGTLDSLKIIQRALFWMDSIYYDSSQRMPGCQTERAYSRCGRGRCGRWRGNSVSKGHGFNPSCDQLFSLGRGSVPWLCKLSQSQPSSKWVPEEVWGR